MPSSPQMSPAMLAMEEELLRADDGVSFKMVTKGADKPEDVEDENAEDVEDENAEDVEDENADELDDIQAELEGSQKEVSELQQELDEAEQWASNMQDIWGKTEDHWLEKMVELRQRASVAAEQDTQEPPHDVSAPVEAERLPEMESLLRESDRRTEEAMSQAAQGAVCIAELEARIVEDGKQGASAEASVLACEARLSDMTAACQESELSIASSQEEVQFAAEWAEGKMVKNEAENKEKDEAITELKRLVEAAQKRPQMHHPESGGHEQTAAKLKGMGQELQTQVLSMEAQLLSERNLCDEVANREKSAKQASQVTLAEQAEAARPESERCADLQKELNGVNQEMKSIKDNLRAQRVPPAVRKIIEGFRQEEKVARKECARSDEALECALSFIGLFKEGHASRCESTHDKQSGLVDTPVMAPLESAKVLVDEVELTLEPVDSISSGNAVGSVTVARRSPTTVNEHAKLGAQAHLSQPRTKSNKSAESAKVLVDEVALTPRRSPRTVNEHAKLGAQAQLSQPRTKSNKSAARAASTKMPVASKTSGVSGARMAVWVFASVLMMQVGLVVVKYVAV